jgi:RNA polymerase-binding transcription factor DksA
MAIGDTTYVNSVRDQLVAGRTRLSEVLGHGDSGQVVRLLEEVDSALQRIDRGTFGICETCHRRIVQERLEALPYARLCMRCARGER